MEAVSAFSCCSVPLTVREDRSCRRGLVSKISICCTVCGKKSSVTGPYHAEDVVVNSRAHLAMRTIEKGRAGLATSSGMMGIAPPITSKHYGTYNQRLRDATDPVREANMSAVASCLRKDADPDEVIDVMVTCDGTWSKRGHTALFGVVVVTSWETGQVLDVEVLSKWCNQCQEKKKECPDTSSAQFLDWCEVHQSLCGQNFIGSSGTMEKEGALTIWKRSIEKHKLRYTTMISDGDSATFPALSRAEP